MAQAGKAAKFVPVGDKLAMADARRAIEFHAIAGSPHAESFLMVYLPQERLIEADAHSRPPRRMRRRRRRRTRTISA